MKILQLNLLAFGPFTNVSIDFSEGEEGLHVVYGLNEAGKSSALRALRQMLYGIPAQSPDDFIHPYAKMRIGGGLRHSDGAVIEFIRRKGRINTLRDGMDQTPLDEEGLQKFLKGIDAGVFESMFGIGHPDLVRGGEEILGGGGEVGKALFSAGSGISDLQQVQLGLQAEAEALFTPASSKRPINQAISSFRANQKILRDIQLPGRTWAEHDASLQKAMERRGDIEHELQVKQAEKHRLARILEALPLISLRGERMAELESYAGAVLLPEDFGERRNQLITELKVAESSRDRTHETMKEITGSMEQLDINEAVINKADLIEAYYRELGSYQKASKDRVHLRAQRDLLRSEAKEVLSGLREDLTLEDSEKLRLKKIETVRIQELGNEYERLMTKVESVQEGIFRLERQKRALKKELETLETPIQVDGLREALERATRYGAIEEDNCAELGEIEREIGFLEAALARQTWWQGPLEELKNLPFPSIETIDTFDHHFDQAEKKMLQVTSELNTQRSNLADIEGQLRELELEQGVPTEEDLGKARAQRLAGWRLLRMTLENGLEPSEEVQAFKTGVEVAGTLVEAYESCVQRADDIADRLRREAERVARKAKLLSDREKQKNRLEQIKIQRESAEAALDEIKKSWFEAWGPVGISPRTPREMRAWVQDQGGIIKRFSDVQTRQKRANDLKTHIDSRRKELDSCLRALSERPIEDPVSLTDLINRGRRTIERQERIRMKREALQTDTRQKEVEMGEAHTDLKRIEKDLSTWQHQWEEAIRPLGLHGKAVPAQANAVMEDLMHLFEKLKEASRLSKRIGGIDRDADALKSNVIDLVEKVARDSREFSVEEAVIELNARLNRSRTAKSQADRLEKQRLREQRRLREAEERISEIRSKLDTMCEEAVCTRYEDLTEAERRSSKRRQLETDLKELEGQLHRLTAGATLEAFIREAREVDPDGIESQITVLSEGIHALSEEKSELDQTIGEERNELKKMDGSAQAAALAEEAQGILAGLEKGVEQFARLKLASAILAQAIERYRKKHQGPVLMRSNELFKQLTLGSFEGIRADYNEEGTPVLMGIRPGGREAVGVRGMSDGTADQLYLALRLASLETYLENNEPVPFIVDDILIKFDNKRATVTLEVLAELSGKTQVIFFTHHHHLLDLAEANIDPSILFKHKL